jgi:putative ABC transport system permease protein
MNTIRFLETLSRDLGYAWRMMRKSPAFAVTAVLTLALGIGATTAIFTVVHAVLLKPLSYHDPDRLVRVSGGATVARFEAIGQARSFTEAGAFPMPAENVTLSGVDGPEPLKGARVSANFLRILGVAPLHGRSFLPEEETPGPPVAIISTELWQRRFGGDPRIVGGTATLDAAPCTIIGVLPPGFQFPVPGMDVWRPWQPSTMPLLSRQNSPILTVFGRLKPGVNLEKANAELAVIHRQYALANPGKLDAKPNQPESVTPMKDQLVRNVRPILWMLFGAVGFVLIIACANVASLLLARATSRSREFAIRAALGAGRGRLAGQLLAESLLLALAGGALGVLLAKWSLGGIGRIPGLDLPRIGEIRLDGMVLGFAVALSVATSLLFGLAPSLSASRPDLARAMKSTGEAADSGWQKRFLLWLSPRGLLVVGQVALSIVLLIGAALLIESLARLRRVDPGFHAANLLTMQFALPQGRYDTTPKISAFFEELVQHVESVPGVRSAAVMMTLPMTGWAGTPVHLVGQPLVKLNERPIAILQCITPEYFRTLEIPLRRGREFASRDSVNAPPVAIINEALARRFWPAYPNSEDPAGHYILAGANPQPLQIVGVVANVRQSGLADDAGLGLYRPRTQTPPYSAMFAVRTEGDPLRFVNAIRSQLLAIDRYSAITAVKTMDDIIEASEGQRRSIMVLLGLFAAAGLLLAVVGIYGVISYSVAQRMKELGIRSALGARQGDILRLVLGQGLGLTLAGAALGIGGALALTRVMKGLLFGVSATDPATFAGITCCYLLSRWQQAIFRRAGRRESIPQWRCELASATMS